MPRFGRLRTVTSVPLIIMSSLVLTGCGGEHEDSPSSDSAGSVEVIPGVVVKADPALHAGLADETRKKGEVRVATDLPYPPFEMFETVGSKQITGIDYDLGQAIGARLGVRLAFSPQKFDGSSLPCRRGSTTS